MGEIADMMLDGTMCQGCGIWLHDGEDGPGFPGWCADCKPSGRKSPTPASMPRKVACPTCGRKVKENGLKDHQRDAHTQGKGEQQ